MGKWTQVCFADCAKLIKKKNSPSDCVELPYIGLEHIGVGTLSLIGTGNAKDVTSIKSCFRKGDILFGKLRPYFRKVIQERWDGICSTDIWVVRPAEGVDAGYLYYTMASATFIDTASLGSEGTRMPRAKWEHVSRMPITLPPLPEKRAIASILHKLDDKIELNRRMNETLETMARAIFKDWFVDFGPTRAKAEGRAPYLAPELWDLFPNALDDEDKPVGWTLSEIGKEVQAVGGGTPSTKEPSYWQGGEHHWATPKDLSKLTSPVLLGTDRKITDNGLDKVSSGPVLTGRSEARRHRRGRGRSADAGEVRDRERHVPRLRLPQGACWVAAGAARGACRRNRVDSRFTATRVGQGIDRRGQERWASSRTSVRPGKTVPAGKIPARSSCLSGGIPDASGTVV